MKNNNLIFGFLLTTVFLVYSKVYEKSWVFFILTFLQTSLIFLEYKYNKLKTHSKFIWPLIILLFVLTLLLSLKIEGFNNFLKPTYLELNTFSERREYLAADLGKIYRNRFAIVYFDKLRFSLTKINQNMFSFLDYDLFFKLNIPYSYIFLALFILGLYDLLRSGLGKNVVVYIFLVFFAAGFFTSGSFYGKILYLPLINLVLCVGMEKSFEYLKMFKDHVK